MKLYIPILILVVFISLIVIGFYISRNPSEKYSSHMVSGLRMSNQVPGQARPGVVAATNSTIICGIADLVGWTLDADTSNSFDKNTGIYTVPRSDEYSILLDLIQREDEGGGCPKNAPETSSIAIIVNGEIRYQEPIPNLNWEISSIQTRLTLEEGDKVIFRVFGVRQSNVRYTYQGVTLIIQPSY